MSESNSVSESGIAARERRARTEQMDVWLLRAGGIYGVQSASGNTYRVDIGVGSCTCPDDRERDLPGGCKHRRRVRLEIERGTVPQPDGRVRTVPDGEQPTPRSVPIDSIDTHEITGPYTEYDKDGHPTGETYYRCSCGREALHRADLRADGCGDDRDE